MLEIYSSGGMVSGISLEGKNLLKIPSKRRNPILADIFSRLKYMERRGSGFKKILADYEGQVEFDETKMPVFDADNDDFTLTLYNLNYGTMAQPQIIRYTYDRQGNMPSEGEKKYSYDSFGRMVRAEVPVEHRRRRFHPLQESFRFRSTVTTEKVCVMRWKKTAVSSSIYTTKTVKLWQKKPAMEQSQGISVDLETS